MVGPASSATFTGRVGELDRLGELLGEAKSGVVAVMLAGESGLGKTELLAEFGRRIEGTATVLSGTCIDIDPAFPYLPLIDALRRWLRGVGEAKVRELAGTAWAEVSTLIADFTGQGPVEGALDSKQKVFGAVSRMLEHIARQSPVVLIFEDVQWADRATLDLVAFLTIQAELAHPVMLVCTYRPGLPARHRLREMLAEQEFIRRVDQLSLPGLSREEIRTLLTKSGYLADWDQVVRYHDQTGGNPYHVLLLAAEGGPTDRVPPSIADILLNRVRQLSANAAEVVRVVAVAGRGVTEQLLAAVCRLAPEQWEAGIQECEERAILIFGRPAGAYSFPTPLLQKAVHDTLPTGARVRMHTSMAEAIAATPSLGLSPPLELAHHWFEAGVLDKALAAGIAAGAFAARTSAFREAEIHYDRLLDLWSRVDDPEGVAGASREHMLAAAADAARWAGHIQIAIDRMREAIAEVGAAALPQRAAELYERLGSYLWEANAVGDKSMDAYRAALELLQDQPPSAIRARVRAAVATGIIRAGRYEEAYRQADEALTEAVAVDDRAAQGRALNSAGLALAMLDMAEDGIASLRTAVEIAEEVGNLEDLLRGYSNLGLALELAGQLSEAVAELQKARAKILALDLVHTRHSRLLANNLSVNLVLLGEWDEAAVVLDTILLDRPIEETTYQRLTRAEIHIARGEFDRAQALIDEVSDQPGGDPRFVGPLYTDIAELELWQEKPETAVTTVVRGLAKVADTENAVVRMNLYAVGLRAVADQMFNLRPRPGRRPRGAPTDPNAELRADLTAEADKMIAAARQTARDRPTSTEVALLAALCGAEHARVSKRDTERQWAEVAEDWDASSRPYPATYARWRQVVAGVRARHKPVAAKVAGAALAAAERLAATPLVNAIKDAVRNGDLNIDQVPPAPVRQAPPRHAATIEFGLTDRELQVLREAANGDTNDAIGHHLGISGNTVGVHLSHITEKMGVNRKGAIATAMDRGWVPE